MGKPAYPDAKRLLITADSGGSNGARVKPWKVELQAFANETGLEIQVSHFPPGTSKWNKIEHRLFSAITLNWRGKPLVSHEVIVSLIQATRTRKGRYCFSRRTSVPRRLGDKFFAGFTAMLVQRGDFQNLLRNCLSPRRRGTEARRGKEKTRKPWVLDVAFGEDGLRTRMGNGPQNRRHPAPHHPEHASPGSRHKKRSIRHRRLKAAL